MFNAMDFPDLLVNVLALIEHHGGHVTWILTFLLAVTLTVCLRYVINKYQIRPNGENDPVPQSDVMNGSCVEELHEEQSPCQICKNVNCAEDHESTFLFDREQYKDNTDVEHIRLTHSHRKYSLTIFEEVNQFKRLTTVTIIGLEICHSSLTSLFYCTSIRSLALSKCHFTTIPRSLGNLKDLEVLDLSHNKLTNLPGKPIRSMSCLKHLNVSHNKIQVIEEYVKTLGAVQEFDLSHNNIQEVPYEILEMKSLKTLNCSHNNITTWLEPSNGETQTRIGSPNIELIDLSNNEIDELPAGLFLLNNLKVLLLGGNRLKKLPSDLDLNQLSPTLCFIDLSDNELDDLPLALCFFPSLERLDVKRNYINKISENIKSCRRLSVLDVSANRLKEIPAHVIRLPKLVEIRASNNQISSVGSLQKDELSSVEVAFLAENGLSHFPEVLLRMPNLQMVDLRNNEIKLIPQSIMAMHKLVELNLKDNPIVDPPFQVCQAGLPAIQAFYEDLTTASSITQCLKTLFLGTYEAGKTSLVRVLKLGRSNLTKPEERTHGIEIDELPLSVPSTSDVITLSVWDFAGQETYYMTHQFFLSAKALMLLVVNLERYDTANFHSTCGNWLENMTAKVGNPVVIPVVTHIDKLSAAEVERKCEELAKTLAEQERMRINDLQKQLKRIDESKVLSSVVVIDRKKQIEALLQKRPSIHPKPVPVSSSESLEGIQYLKQVILNYAVNKELFPEVGRPVPKAWADTEACVLRKGDELSFPYLTWSEFASLLKENVPNLQPESRIKTVAQYLHDTGKILWYSDVDSLSNHVFLKPASLVDVFRKVIRHDFGEAIDYDSDPCYIEAEISQANFQRMKNDLVRNGVLHSQLLRCLWSNVEKQCPSGQFEIIFEVLIELMRQFDLCYDLEVLEKGGHTREEVRPQQPVSQKFLLPWHIKEDEGDMAKSQWKSGGSPVISLQYQFPSFIPPGLFARLTVRAHHNKHNLHFTSHWNTGVLCKHRTNSILVLLRKEGMKGLVVSLSARPEGNNAHLSALVEVLWATLLALRVEVEDLLKQWPGVLFDRFAVCPECRRPSFPGDWHHLTLRRSDGQDICPFCNERVLLKCVQPPGSAEMLGWAKAVMWLIGERQVPRDFPVPDQQLLRVASSLGAEWETIAIHMGFSQADVYRFKRDNPYNTQQQIFTMLTTWRDREGRNATRDNLQRVLIEAGCGSSLPT